MNPSLRPLIALLITSALPPAQALSQRISSRGDLEPITIPGPHTATLSQVGRLANIRVMDRASGTALPIYEHQGEYWVVGTSGNHYAISMQRRQGQGRTLAVTSVDGINVISGQTAEYLQTGYVLSGFGAYEINGWRKSLQEVAAFTFAAPNDSYASKTGRTANLGVIGVALFTEQQERHSMQRREFGASDASKSVSEPLNESPLPPATTNAPAGASSESRQSAELSRRAQSPLSPGLGTGHGQREASLTQNVAFKRANNAPDEVIQIRYDSAQNMVRRGVLAYAQALSGNPSTVQAFSRSMSFVADPPRHPQ